MMQQEKDIISWIMSGKKFSPRHIQTITGFEYSYQHENGDKVHLKNEEFISMEDGSAIIKVEIDRSVNWERSIFDFITLMESSHEILVKNGLETLIFHLDVLYADQCNIDLNGSILGRLHHLGAKLTISAYKV